MDNIKKYGLMHIKTGELVKINPFVTQEGILIYELVRGDEYKDIWMLNSKEKIEQYVNNPITDSNWKDTEYISPLNNLDSCDVKYDFAIVVFDISMSFYF